MVWLKRIVLVLIGTAIGLYGAALYALRCFDTCPSDPTEDRTITLLCASIMAFGLGVVAAGASVGVTRWRVATKVVAMLGVLIVLAGAAVLMMSGSLEFGSERLEARKAAALAALGGSALIAYASIRRRSYVPGGSDASTQREAESSTTE